MSENQVTLFEWRSKIPENRMIDIEENPCLIGNIDITNTNLPKELKEMLNGYDIQHTFLNFEIYHTIGLETEEEKNQYLYCFKLKLMKYQNHQLIDELPPRIGDIFVLIYFIRLSISISNLPISFVNICECSCSDISIKDDDETKAKAKIIYQQIKMYDKPFIIVEITHPIDDLTELKQTLFVVNLTVDNIYPFVVIMKLIDINNGSHCSTFLIGQIMMEQMLLLAFKEGINTKWTSI